MAIIFELWAECADADAGTRLAAHFHGRECRLVTGKLVTFRSDRPRENVNAVSVWSPQLSDKGVRTVTDALEMTEAGLWLYHGLRESPDFVFARVAMEAGCVPLDDLPDWLTQHGTERRLTVECVMSSTIFASLGNPAFCYTFRPGYVWTRYSGEDYSPLNSTDQPALDAVKRNLFPE